MLNSITPTLDAEQVNTDTWCRTSKHRHL